MTTKLKAALQNVKLMNIDQLNNAIVKINEASTTLKTNMQNMGTQYKIKVAIPMLRDYDVLRKRLTEELNARQKK